MVTSRYNVLKAARRHPGSVGPVTRWLTVITAAECGSLVDVRKVYPSADQAGKTLIFKIRWKQLPIAVLRQLEVPEAVLSRPVNPRRV